MGGHVIGLLHTITMLDVIDILVVAFFSISCTRC